MDGEILAMMMKKIDDRKLINGWNLFMFNEIIGKIRLVDLNKASKCFIAY